MPFPETMWIQVLGSGGEPGPGPTEKTAALVFAIWAEARVETSEAAGEEPDLPLSATMRDMEALCCQEKEAGATEISRWCL